MCRFAKMILRDRCSTSYDLPSIFVAGAVSAALNFPSLKEVSPPNCFAFDVVMFKN